MAEESSVLIVGAREGSLGEHVAQTAQRAGYAVHTVGLNLEDSTLDITNSGDLERFWRKAPLLDHVVCTAGINVPTSLHDKDFYRRLVQHFYVNVVGTLNMLDGWLRQLPAVNGSRNYRHHFVGISSNSDTIARTRGAPYCASKAALTMALRCAAREIARDAGDKVQPLVYSYSPGWMTGTPMSVAIEERLFEQSLEQDRPIPMHRIPGNCTVDPAELAELIVHNITDGGDYLNGTNIRLDGGES